MHWKDIREKTKKYDRYYKEYKNPENFWTTLDSKIVAWTYNIPSVGARQRKSRSSAPKT